MGGQSVPDSPDVMGAAREQAEFDRLSADRETWANRPDQYGPTGSTTWNQSSVDGNTGEPIVQLNDGTWVPKAWHDEQVALGNRVTGSVAGDAANNSDADYMALHLERNPGATESSTYGGPRVEGVNQWEQNTQLNPEWQEALDNGRGLLNSQIDYRMGEQDRWSGSPVDYGGGVGGGSIKPGQTISTGDLGQFGQNQANLGAQDWRQFGTTGQTIGQDDYRQFGQTESQIGGDDWRQFGTTESQINGDDWRQFGNTEQTIGQDDWRQYGNTEQTLDGGSYDARFGDANADPTGGYGAHDQGPGNWDQISYTPDAIRRQAEQETLSFMNSQLDPQWDSRQSDLESQLTNQGLQWGDAAWDKAMESQKNSRDQAYSGARNQALADSRAEANMLWGQEMSRSEQKNMQTQADLDNTYRARQANIGNYQSTQGQEQQNYLAYQREAFGQDLSSRQQQLDADLNFGREAHSQDFSNRQQQLNANLDYGREGFNQDLASRQQQLNANLDYGREGFQQDLQGRQQNINSDLSYGREAFGQDLASRQQQLDANRNYSNDAFNQDLQARQANIGNYLNYGSEAFNQDLQGNRLNLDAMSQAERDQMLRYQAANPNETANTIGQIVG